MVDIGNKLRSKRTEMGKTQADFAKMLDMKLSTYERLENNRNNDVRLDTLVKISNTLNIPFSELLPETIVQNINNQKSKGSIGIVMGGENNFYNQYSDPEFIKEYISKTIQNLKKIEKSLSEDKNQDSNQNLDL